jgi:hypothetical protein
MNDETLLKTVQNSLMIAGHEMGPVGDHWPAINAIHKGVEEEFEEADRDQAVVAEMEFHFADLIRQLEEAAKLATPAERPKVMKEIQELWSEYYAVFEPVHPGMKPDIEDLELEGMKTFPHLKSAINVLKMMGGSI